jgi:hypothetical protein
MDRHVDAFEKMAPDSGARSAIPGLRSVGRDGGYLSRKVF